MDQSRIRNIAIIAHIDHGKTTLVDFLLKQSHVFRDNSEEMSQDLIMDSNDLERERGITILAKNTAITYKTYKINIIDTPGHADFGGEVERTLTMADGCILLVDAQEGPMPQTRFVLQKALELNLKPIVVINKIDKAARRIQEVTDEIGSLFLELARHEAQLDFPILYAVGREGKAWDALPDDPSAPATLEPLFEKIVSYMPAPTSDINGSLQLRIAALDYDDFKGSYAIGRVERGTIKAKTPVMLIDYVGAQKQGRIENLYTWEGLKRVEATEVIAGDIVAITGLGKISINTTVTSLENPEALPVIAVEEPTLRITLSANTSPFVGKEGSLLNSRQLKERLEKELEINIALRMETQGEKFMLTGRGELHLSILLETLRREDFEVEVSKPTVVTKIENNKTVEPYEEVVIDVPEMYRGTIISELARRQAELKDTFPHASDIRFVYEMPTRSLLGLRSALLVLTRGSFVLNSRFMHFGPSGPTLPKTRGGALIAHESGKAVAFGLEVAQGRGVTFVEPGTDVYEGMIVGENSREEDLEINVCKGKELTNMRSKSSDGIIQLAPPVRMTLEQALDFIEDDELVEITPKSIRLRKKSLSKIERDRGKRK
ncbi:MAG: translational GTPase TypA [Patescibacteria group bacterium]